MVQRFFRNESIEEGLNNTNICLLPKKMNSKKLIQANKSMQSRLQNHFEDLSKMVEKDIGLSYIRHPSRVH